MSQVLSLHFYEVIHQWFGTSRTTLATNLSYQEAVKFAANVAKGRPMEEILWLQSAPGMTIPPLWMSLPGEQMSELLWVERK